MTRVRSPASGQARRTPKPDWLRVRPPVGPGVERTRLALARHEVHTICQEALCPNRGECWEAKEVSFLILGDICTRACGFCAVATGKPGVLDETEPRRVAGAARELGLSYVVITSVDRDDLPDGGARQFARTVSQLKAEVPGVKVEVLIPDFRRKEGALEIVLDSPVDCVSHNIETVPRLYPVVRRGSEYAHSLGLLRRVHTLRPDLPLKTGLMVGLGETKEEILETMRDIRRTGCSLLTVGQYLQPTKMHLPVAEYKPPAFFRQIEEMARALGFARVAAGPRVRSSYRGEDLLPEAP